MRQLNHSIAPGFSTALYTARLLGMSRFKAVIFRTFDGGRRLPVSRHEKCAGKEPHGVCPHSRTGIGHLSITTFSAKLPHGFYTLSCAICSSVVPWTAMCRVHRWPGQLCPVRRTDAAVAVGSASASFNLQLPPIDISPWRVSLVVACAGFSCNHSVARSGRS